MALDINSHEMAIRKYCLPLQMLPEQKMLNSWKSANLNTMTHPYEYTKYGPISITKIATTTTTTTLKCLASAAISNVLHENHKTKRMVTVKLYLHTHAKSCESTKIVIGWYLWTYRIEKWSANKSRKMLPIHLYQIQQPPVPYSIPTTTTTITIENPCTHTAQIPKI